MHRDDMLFLGIVMVMFGVGVILGTVGGGFAGYKNGQIDAYNNHYKWCLEPQENKAVEWTYKEEGCNESSK